MTTIIIIFIIIVAIIIYIYYKDGVSPKTQKEPVFPPVKLMDLKTTTVGERQRMYKRGFRKQRQFDELQRRAEAAGDTATIEAIRLGTYDGPLPPLPEEVRNPLHVPVGSTDGENAPIQELKYFCVKDKGYHVTVWPNDVSQFDIVEFNIAGMSHRDNIDDYLGEFKGTLEAEPTNAYDPNAIKVLAPDGHHVGYVPKNMTSEVRNESTLPCPCFCYIGCNNGTYFSDCYITRK